MPRSGQWSAKLYGEGVANTQQPVGRWHRYCLQLGTVLLLGAACNGERCVPTDRASLDKSVDFGMRCLNTSSEPWIVVHLVMVRLRMCSDV